MKKILKIELNRAFYNIGMIISLMIGMGCVFYQIIPVIYNMEASKRIWEINDIYVSFTRGGFYTFWLPSYLNGATIYYFYFIGIIVALPFGASFYRDKKTGVIRNICNRIDKKKYLIAKYVSTFISGGTAVTIPLVIDFLIVKLIIPYDNFDIEGTILNAITEWGVFIIDKPYAAAVIILFSWFIFGGALASISLMVSSISENFFTIQLAPFFVMLILFYLPNFLPVGLNKYFPFYFLSLFGKGNPIIALTESILIVLITFAVFIIRELRKDIL